MKPIHIIIGIIVLALVGGLVASALRQPTGTNVPAQAGANWKLSKVEGGEGQLADYKGQVVLINFWASWCGTCREEMPDIVQAWREYGDQGFTVIGINYGETTEEAIDFMRAYGMEFPNFLDPDLAVAGQYGVISMPSSYLIDRSGEVRLFIPGKIDFSQLRPEIENLLEEQT